MDNNSLNPGTPISYGPDPNSGAQNNPAYGSYFSPAPGNPAQENSTNSYVAPASSAPASSAPANFANPYATSGAPGPMNPGAPITSGPTGPYPVSSTPAPTMVGSAKKSSNSSLAKTIAIVILSLFLATFIGLFIWMYVRWYEASNNLQTQIDAAVNEAVDENTEKMNAKFDQQEKYPYYTFSGPVDYGELTFEYPKTWSLYVESDASDGKDYHAYLNPGNVNPISKSNVNAVRVSILNESTDSVLADYEKFRSRKEVNVTVDTITVGGTSATRYTGDLKDTDSLKGYAVIFRIRDKTVVLQSDSLLFESDFTTLLTTVKFNA